MKYAAVLLISFSLLIPGLLGSISARADSNTFVVWASTDSHVDNGSLDHEWYDAINDSNTYFNFDIAIIGGDIVNGMTSSPSEWPAQLSRWKYITEQSSHPYSDFYPITGNHEVQEVWYYNGTGGWDPWNTTINPLNNTGRKYPVENGMNNVHFTINVGNLLFVCFGPDWNASVNKTTSADYANRHSAQFEWWRSIVENNTDKNIICVTHQSLYGSGLTPASWGPYIDGGADEYTSWLDSHSNHSIVAWICGHEHYVSSDVRKSTHWGITHIRASAIDKDHAGNERHSYLFTFTNGSKTVSIGDFDHDTDSWDSSGSPGNFTFELKYPFSLSAPSTSPSVIDSATFTMEATVSQNETPSPSLTLLDSKVFTMSAVVLNESVNNGSGFTIPPSSTPYYYVLAGMLVFFPFLAIVYKKWR